MFMLRDGSFHAKPFLLVLLLLSKRSLVVAVIGFCEYGCYEIYVYDIEIELAFIYEDAVESLQLSQTLYLDYTKLLLSNTF